MIDQIKNKAMRALRDTGMLLPLVVGVVVLVCAEWGYAQTNTTIDLGAGNGDVRLLGGGANDETGAAVIVGDLDGDGYAEMIISASRASPGGRYRAGKIYIVRGSASPTATVNLATQADMVVLGRTANDELGYPALEVADVNNDGYGDLLIGTRAADPYGRGAAGQVYIIFGQATLPASIDLSSTSADMELSGAEEADLLGASLATGDFNGDNLIDIAVSAPDASPPGRLNAGITYIIYGATAGLPATIDLATDSVDVKIFGRAIGDGAGTSLATLDMNGDNIDDVVIGASAATGGNNRGEAYVVLGSAAPTTHIDLLTSADLRVRGNAVADLFSNGVDGGDVNRDGYDDLIVGAPTFGSLFEGRTYVFFGSAIVSDFIDLSAGGTADLIIDGNGEYAYLGWDVGAINYNGDGYADLIMDAPFSSTTNGLYSGAVHGVWGQQTLPAYIDLAISGNPNFLSIEVLGAAGNDYLGLASSGGDVNGDGVDDLLIGAQGANSLSGEAYLIFGVTPYLKVSISSTSASYGQPLTLAVNIDSTSGMLVAESVMDISFNRNLLTFTGLDNSGTLASTWSLGYTISAGSVEPIDTLKVMATNLGAPLTSKGLFLNLNFFVNKLRDAITSQVALVQLTFNGGESDWNDTSSGSVTLLGNDGTVESTVISEPGDTVRVKVKDVDLNIDPLAVEVFNATLQNSRSGESESVVLTEQSVDDTIFFGQLATIFGAGGANDDGVMQAQAGDTLFVQYDDPLSMAGPVNALLDTHQVVVLGDADGSGVLQAFDGALILSHAVGHALLTGRDSLVANLDANAPYSSITAFDAALAIQRRLGMIARFPVQESSSQNQPQPETSNNAKPVVSERFLAVQSHTDFIAVQLEDRSEIIAADLVLEGIEGRVEMAVEMELFEMVYHNAEDGLHVSFAGPRPLSGNGELFRIYPTDAKAQVKALSGHFNGGRISARLNGAQLLAVQPLRFALHENMPNPFNAETLIRFDLPNDALASLDVFNALGQKVRTLVQGRLDAGSHRLRWDSRDDRGTTLASGVYFYRLVAGERVQTQRMMLVK
jgi:hypothetical protein